MGQKVNPNILRSEITGYWKLKLYPLNYQFESLINYKIRKLLQWYFKVNKLVLIKIKFKRKEKNYLNLFVFKNSFFFNRRGDTTFTNLGLISWYGEYWYELNFMKDSKFLNIILKKKNKDMWIHHKNITNIATLPIYLRQILKKKRVSLKTKKIKLYSKKSKINLKNKKFKILNYWSRIWVCKFYNYTFHQTFMLVYNILKFLYSSLIQILDYWLQSFYQNKTNILIKLIPSTVIKRIKKKFLSVSIVIKFLMIELEILILFFFKQVINVNIYQINKILLFNKYIEVPKTAMMWVNEKRFYFKDLVRGIFLGITLKDSTIVSFFLIKHLSNRRDHKSYMKGVKRILLSFLSYLEIKEFFGLKIEVRGKIQGKLRKKIFKIYKGYRSLLRKKNIVSYSMSNQYSRFGAFSAKVWIFYKW